MSTTKLFRVSPLTAALAVILFMPASSLAATGENNNDREIKDTQTVNDRESVIIVTAPAISPLTIVTSPKTPRQPVPASDGSDYLKTIPGFSQIRNGGTNGDPVFRGMFGSRLRMLVDDGEILGSCPSRMDAPSSYISPESYDVLSLVKGPQTVLWGAGNSAGTVRFERTRPQFDKLGAQGNISTVAASNGRWDGNADLSFGNELGYVRLSGNKSRSNDYKDGDGNRVPSRWDKWNTDIAVGWTPDDDTLLELTAGQGDGKARYAGRSMDGSKFKRESFGVRFEKSNISDVFDKFETNFYYNYTNHIMDNYSLRTPSPMSMGGHGSHGGGKHGGHGMGAMELDRRTMGGRMMGTWIWEDFKLQSGVDTQSNTHRNKYDTVWVKDARYRNYGIFSELTWDATEQSKVIGGARLDRVLVNNYVKAAERTATLPSGFIRFEHNLTEVPLMFYAGVGYTERFPDYWELFDYWELISSKPESKAFRDLKTEKTTQLDIGVQYHGQYFSGWVSAYVGKVNDFILFRYSPTDRTKSQANNVDATIMGGEMGASYQLSDHWKTDASLAYSWAKNTSDHRPLPQTPPLEARFGLTWEHGDWTSSGLLRVVSSQNRVSINEGNVVGKDFDRSAGFAILSANTAYKVTKNVQVSAGIDNIFDRTYSEHLNLAGSNSFGYSGNTPVNEPGRTYWARVNVKF
ncbi:TonB-dependent copper receptor [Xenorhabdus bovienii]|uniref:TonB-dependent copper receptor n=1 Tax=Xenorhabdus bovienii TaxID=40576 RepID=UPI0004DB0C59|nr:TonB-dependent copper receptor [Xenorhabdus bovienii]CDG90044.1 putative outer membrane copper receptor (OprC) [Xenorhabdus bovienii str. feltiae France]CDG93308.1 putative outer membrane copper receptor (OprC) [Xenorhabdus bovienii str. feltiae Florida]